MAEYDMGNIPDINLLKSTKILVYVEEALQDLLVVSYVFDSKFFQGILLNSTKKRIPAGINLPLSQNKVSLKGNSDEDVLYKAINQRFTYFQNLSEISKWNCKKTKNGKIKNTRMNVRLRPRQVLCSKCRSICTENNENVDHSKKTSGDQPGSKLAVAVENSKRSLRLSTVSSTFEKSPRPLLYDGFKNHQMKTRSNDDTQVMLTSSLIPKLPRLQPSETNTLTCKYSPKLSLLNGNYCFKSVVASPKSESSDNKFSLVNVDQELAVSLPETGSIPQKSAVDMEIVRPLDNINEEESKMVLRKKHSIGSMEDLWDESIFEDQMQKTKTTPVLKISFGTEGQGTVLKIPAKVTNNSSESENDESHVETRSMIRAARKAHKKAKKEAKKRMIAISSPARSPAYENFFGHRSRHKMKRKRKHKYPQMLTRDKCDIETEKNKNEKLSMSFKRLGGNAYTATRNESPSSSPNTHSSEEGIAPNVPESNLELESVQYENDSYKTKNGKIIEIGDVVWGKVHGFSWWPGKIITFKISVKEKNKIYAYISWFGSSTASVISCDNLCPFLDNYKLRFNKRKKSGQYKEAVKIATVEAKKKRGIFMRTRNLTDNNR